MTTRKVEKLILAAPSEVFTYFTNSTALRDWLCTVATTDPRPGGRLYMWWDGGYFTSGEFLKIETDARISFSWFGKDEPRATQVDVTLKAKKSGTLVKLTHRKIGNSDKWKKIGDTYEKEWVKGLENLASVLGQGPDLRIVNRPMLGIYVDDFNASIALKLGVPVTQGLRLSGVLEGLGAQKAGLQSDDVIIMVDGHEVTGAASLGPILVGKITGDTVDVTYYRCSELKTTKMTLMGRQIPPIPTSGVELSTQSKPSYDRFEAELEEMLNNASEEECAKKPSPNEWSANEVLAHLIQSEIGWQNQVAEILGGNEGAYDGYGENFQPRIDGTLAAYPSKDALLKELKAHDAETLSMLANLPQETLAHKGRFWKLVLYSSQNPSHFRGHLDQIKAALKVVQT